MEVVIAAPEELAQLAAGAIGTLLRSRPDAVPGLATGSSPLPIYDELVRLHVEDGFSFARSRAFTLDEYVGLPKQHPQRYRNVIEHEMTGRVDFVPGAFHGPDGLAEDVTAACAAYEAAIAEAGGVDLQLLGIGTDGHVGFNEPGSSLASRTRIKTLTEQTRADKRALLRRGHRPGAAPLPDPGSGHDHGGTSHRADRDRSGQGRRGPPARRGSGERHVARHDSAASPARHRAGRQRCSGPAPAGRLLPQHLRGQAPWQGL